MASPGDIEEGASQAFVFPGVLYTFDADDVGIGIVADNALLLDTEEATLARSRVASIACDPKLSADCWVGNCCA
jgi:hypothetical protein